MREFKASPNEYEIDNSGKDRSDRPVDQSRRKFLRNLALAGGGAIAAAIAGKKTLDYLSTSDVEREYGIKPLDEIAEFQDFGDGALVICDNDFERDTVIAFLRLHSQQRTPNTRYQVSVNSGVGRARIPVRKREDKGLRPGDYPHGLNSVGVTVVTRDTRALDNLGSNYGLVQLRGHTSAMPGLIEEYKQHHREHNILAMGGCEAVQFMKDLHNEQTAIIAGKMDIAATSSQNSHTLASLVDRVGLMDSWEEFNQVFTGLSENLREHTVIPGARDYYAYASGKKR